MNPSWLEEALLMSHLGTGATFPRDLMCDVLMALPVTVEELKHLTAHGVQQWLLKRHIRHVVSPRDRDLHGCLVARAGQAVIFLDACDGDNERRFTLAHEIAHFILDHLLPRVRALNVFGNQIAPVLDGHRHATPDEMLSAVLHRVPLGLHVHLMKRGPYGTICAWDVDESERRADRLALELLAPAHAASSILRRNIGDQVSRRLHGPELLASHFGLPLEVAKSYVELILGRTRRKSLTEEIFGSR